MWLRANIESAIPRLRFMSGFCVVTWWYVSAAGGIPSATIWRNTIHVDVETVSIALIFIRSFFVKLHPDKSNDQFFNHFFSTPLDDLGETYSKSWWIFWSRERAGALWTVSVYLFFVTSISVLIIHSFSIVSLKLYDVRNLFSVFYTISYYLAQSVFEF